ncbi:MAG: COX15/CtaA family protein [Blastocatellia bacterium]
MSTINSGLSAKLNAAARTGAGARDDSSRAVTIWLFTVCALVALMVIVGGWVRLTRSGLSITEWKVITGILPPLSETAWQEQFARYQQSPEFRLVNATMTLAEYRSIFYLEYIHRLIGRLAGLVVVVPLAFFLIRGIIPWRSSAVYLSIAALFGFQGFLGWYMVASGLVDRPHVSHYRLAIHLLMALLLLGLTLWLALSRVYGEPGRGWSAPGAMLLIILLMQITYGALVAGLKAGGITNTWPLMFGSLVPASLLGVLSPWWLNPVESPVTVHFIHRWFAFAVLIIALAVYVGAGRRSHSANIRRSALTLALLVCIQIAVGVSVVLLSVPVSLALFHQAVALMMFAVAVFLNHRLAAA